MAKQNKKIEMIVIGDAKSCNACKLQKEFMAKNKKQIVDAGITDIRFVKPDSVEAELYQKKYLNGVKAQPLTVIKSDDSDSAFAGFAKQKILKEIKNGVKIVKKGGFFDGLFD